ncbi:MAG: SH3 domain-containing protein [Anaerolineae bacterium]|nr:SH3 domain-containing protein [Anaerolineae bacterium]
MNHKRLWLLVGLVVSILLFSNQTLLAQNGFQWTVSYFNNEWLSGNPVVTQTVSSLNMNWGTNAPAPGVNADHWSARFSTSGYFVGGTYRFTLSADDSVHLILDNANYLIDNYDTPHPDQTWTADVTLTTGVHNLQVDLREVTSIAYVNLSWTMLGSGSTPPQPANGIWVAQYYTNTNLSGTPYSTFNEYSPTHNWGSNSPLSGFPADNFSVRWTEVQYFSEGTYEFTVRSDDGVRVRLDNQTVIDQWHLSDGGVYTGRISVTPGNHTVTVEYFEQGGIAYIDYSLRQVTTSEPTPIPPSQPRAQINTGTLNFRSAATTASTILGKLSRGSIYPILGRLADNSWWQIQVNGVTGWVSGRYVIALDAQNVPIVDGSASSAPPVPSPSGAALTTTANLSLRSGPSTSNSRMTVIPARTAVQIVGRNASQTWWQVVYDNRTGWVSGRYVQLNTGTDVNSIPVTANN